MKNQIERLKAELREFIALSETVIEKPWMVDGLSLYANDKPIVCTATPHESVAENSSMARFIARSRNISPAMAECLLVAIDHIGLSEAAMDVRALQQIITVWGAAR
jgi:hypothetical protein